jgi:outer membrane protein assembly factor BamB
MSVSYAKTILTGSIFSVALLSLSACSWFSSKDEPKPAALVSFKSTADLDRKWSDHVGYQGSPELYIRLRPVIAGDVIYAASADGDVTAINRNKGKDLWSISTHEELISAVGAGDGLVLVSTINGVLIALSSEDGSEAWRANLSSEMLAAAQASDGVVVAQTIDGKVSGFDRSKGTLLWQYNATIPSLTLRSSASPVIEDGIVYVVLASGRVIALDSHTGLQQWEQQVALPEGRTELERILDFDGQPLLVGDDLYVSGYQGYVSSLAKKTGKIQWSEKLSTTGQPSYGNGNLYVTQSDDTVVALKMATGRHLWENNQFALRQLTAPVVIGNYVAVADFEGYIHLLNQSDGQLADRYSLWFSEGVRNTLLSDEGLSDEGLSDEGLSDETAIYVLANSGKITALTLDKD